MQAPALFDAQSSLRSDRCNRLATDRENARIQEYVLRGRTDETCSPAGARRPDLDHRNLLMRPGYGVADQCTIDTDSRLRVNPGGLTNMRDQHQLFTRVYQAVPDLRGGLPRPDVESRLIQAEMTPSRKCSGGVEWDKPFLPMQACVASAQDPAHIVPTWTWGGEATRDYVRRPDACTLLRTPM